MVVGWILFRMIKKQWWKGLGILSAVLLAAVVLFFWKNPVERLKYDLQKLEVTDAGISIKMKGRKMVIFILCCIIKKNLFTLLQMGKTAFW